MLKRFILAILCISAILASSAYAEESRHEKKMKYLFSQLKKERDNIIGVELLVADAIDEGPIFSKFGHAMLVFVHKNQSARHNIVLSLVADMSGASGMTDVVIDGVAGNYDLVVEFARFYNTHKQYVLGEARSIVRHIIPSNKKMRDNLIDNIDSYFNGKSETIEYKFFTQNCVTELLRFLDGAGFPVETDTIIPTNAPEELVKQSVLTQGEIRVSTKEFKDIYTVVPEDLYNICDTRECAEDIIAAEESFWNEDELSAIRFNRLQIARLRKESSIFTDHTELLSSSELDGKSVQTLGRYDLKKNTSIRIQDFYNRMNAEICPKFGSKNDKERKCRNYTIKGEVTETEFYVDGKLCASRKSTWSNWKLTDSCGVVKSKQKGYVEFVAY